MPASYTINVGPTPIRIAKLPYGVQQSTVYLTNESQTGDVFIGDQNVTENAGFLVTKQLGTGVSYRAEFVMYAGQELWACARAGSTGTIHVGYSA